MHNLGPNNLFAFSSILRPNLFYLFPHYFTQSYLVLSFLYFLPFNLNLNNSLKSLNNIFLPCWLSSLIFHFFFKFRCFSAATTIFSVVDIPFLALILSSSILAALYSTLSTPFYSISSSVNGTKNGSSLCIFQVSNLNWAFTVPLELSCKLKQNLCDLIK